ncbi:serine/threonine-protein kinase [Streptomyces sp. NPDC046909]|uniref:serine/threonine-protein kinase n=1 Tax=Streptomyces sp. NPDC046909 TaxID=3155617 RepID=UPI0033E88C51
MDALTTEDPQHIGPYRLLARLGAGGMGRVYLARSEGGRTVAVKVVRAEYAEQPEFRQRFAHEVAAALRVGGRWTAPVLDADTEAATPWVATGYVPGPDLHSVVADEYGPLPEHSLRALTNGLAHALRAVHGAALVHRDLKPSNVLLTIDGPRVIDFGIARALDGMADGIRTRTGAVIGSPGFMSPEQVRGQRLTPASDVFCLGSVLAFAATGRMPFGTADSGVHAVMFRIAEEEPDLDGVPYGILDLVRACLQKKPAERPTVEHLLAWTSDAYVGDGTPWLPGPLLAGLGSHAARLLDADAPVHTPPPAPTLGGSDGPTRPPRPSRSRARWIAAATAVAVTAAGAVVATRLSGDTETKDDDKPAPAGESSAETHTFGGAWAGIVQRSDSSVADEHEYLRIDVDENAEPGRKAADFVYLSKEIYCKVESTLGSKKGDTLTLASFKVVKAVPAEEAKGACDLSRTKGIKSSPGKLTWTMGDMTADLKPVANTGNRPVPAKFLGTWESEIQGTLTLRQGPVGTKAQFTGWSIDWRCHGTAELVSASDDLVNLSPLELDASTPRGIGCPHGVPTTLTWKSANELEMRYPESGGIRLTRVK